ncbi:MULTISPECIES: helix-turn-helix transcriptional regulator [Rhodomicrobium]|uniref:helix-turn-helix transcriptional regulator n=1 Tax=Rhodomicrobium TaxID=1068 RepID=UPI001481DF1E|nr:MULTISPECIES: helix-turn-helix transcriptional regulator [Rhodomicrobium]
MSIAFACLATPVDPDAPLAMPMPVRRPRDPLVEGAVPLSPGEAHPAARSLRDRPRRHRKIHGLDRVSLGRVIGFIADEMGNGIALSDLAAIAGVSRFHFIRLFKASTGLTPMAYLERARIARAQEMMGRGGLSLSQIALMVGFADQSHFTRRFRRHAGCTPSVFANRMGQQPPRGDRS